MWAYRADWRHVDALLAASKIAYNESKNICVWTKNNAGIGSFYRSQHELVCIFKSGKGPHRNNIELGRHGRNRTNVWSYPGATTFSRTSDEGPLLGLHPTVKPVRMVADAILDVSRRGDIVLDPFGGSGGTVISAERTGRQGQTRRPFGSEWVVADAVLIERVSEAVFRANREKNRDLSAKKGAGSQSGG